MTDLVEWEERRQAATALEAKDKELAALRESDSDKKRLLDLQEVAYRNMKARAETAERERDQAREVLNQIAEHPEKYRGVVI